MKTKQNVFSKLKFWIYQPMNGQMGPTILLRNEILHFTLRPQRKKLLILLVEHQHHQILIKPLLNFQMILGVKSVVLWKEDITMDRSQLIHKLWLLVDIQSTRPQLAAGKACKLGSERLSLFWVITICERILDLYLAMLKLKSGPLKMETAKRSLQYCLLANSYLGLDCLLLI